MLHAEAWQLCQGWGDVPGAERQGEGLPERRVNGELHCGTGAVGIEDGQPHGTAWAVFGPRAARYLGHVCIGTGQLPARIANRLLLTPSVFCLPSGL